ncbi:MAG: aspartate--tRNA ligase [Patescibacteria group bacterium]|nr:aspartate--tRNA ligase [Patescibacteria group bacterium]
MRTLIADITKKSGEKVELFGWVAVRRDHGKLIFIDLRDRSGICQVVFIGKDKELYEKASKLRSEWVVKITGQVNARPEKLVNPNLATGAFEVLAEGLEILNEATTPPFDLSTDGKEVGEEIRMKYRYVDLRRERMQNNIRNRDKVIAHMRDFLRGKEFIEVETPVLSKSTPEGARDYLVPSRLYPGKFYALPQSPQQYKQLLMAAGMERYFQVARCFRDEDTRGDRQPEFTQLDMEMSFVDENDVMGVVEEMLIDMVKTLYPHKKIQQIPFPRITYKDAMEKYGNDRPDIRENKDDPDLLAFCWVVDFPFFEKTDNAGWTFTHNPFSSPKPEHREWLMEKKNIGEILTTQYDIVLNGFEVGGGSIRNHQPEALKRVFEIMGFAEERIYRNFGHMLEALGSGAPPHGGIAPGVDRLIMILQNEPNIREVMAFPKTGDGRDLMMEAPSDVSADQLKELGIEFKKKK